MTGAVWQCILAPTNALCMDCYAIICSGDEEKKYFSVINHIFFLVGIRVLHQKHVSVNLCVLSLISVHCLDEYLQKKVILGLENTECNTGLLQKTALPKTV